MADFRNVRAEPVAPQITAKRGIEDNSSSVLISGLADVGNNLFSTIAANKKNDAKTAQNKLLSGYQRELLKLADGVEQKRLTPANARSRARALHNSFIANNPSLTGAVSTLHNKTLQSAGLGKIIGEKSVAEEAKEAEFKAAFKEGFVTENMSEDQMADGIAKYRSYERAKGDLADEAQRLAVENAKTNLTKSQLSLRTAQQQERATKVLDNVASGVRTKVLNTVSTLREDLRKGKFTRDDAIRRVEEAKALWQSEVFGVARAAKNEDIKLIMGPIDRIFDIAKDEFSGKLTREVAENEISILENGVKANLLKDKRLAKLYAIGKLLPNTNLSTIAPAREIVDKILAQNSFPKADGSPTTPANLWDQNDRDQLKTHRALSSTLKDNMRAVASGKDSSPETVQQVGQNLENILKATDVYKDVINEPKKLNEVYDLIASPEFGRFTSNNKLDKGVMAKALTVYQDRYENKALPLIEEMWNQPDFRAHGLSETVERQKSKVSVQDNIDVNMTETGVVFSTKSGNQLDKSMTNIFNRDMGPVLNKLIRATAHLEGHTNYKEVYERRFKPIFEPEEVESPTGKKTDDGFITGGAVSSDDVEGSQGDDTLEDFKTEDPAKIAPLIQPADISDASTIFDLIGKTEGTDKGNSYNETLAFGKFTGGDVNLVGMTISEVMKLQKQMLQHPENSFNSSAVGRYQIVGTTLRGLVKELGLTGKEKFDEKMQDKLAMTLLKRRGFDEWKAGELSDDEFIDKLSQEWASLPTAKGGGFYTGQRAAIDADTFREFLKILKKG